VWARLQGIPVPKILVADDNANIQKMVVLAFEERGIQVVSVGNGEAAVRRIPDLNPDLVLADIFMPVRNGYEVCEFVKKDERFAHVPVILLVGAFDPLDEKEARRVGADGVLKKPFVPPDPLIAMVTSALEKNPKVAAEMAKAREAKVALPEPELPKLEIPSRAEPKPLPDFPEPTPEEAALVYGFGKGVRQLEDESSEVVAGPKPPVAEKDEAEDDDFDGSSTSSDWRRNAMDFEVPADSVNKPAFADEQLDESDFPSESEYPPRRVRPSQPVEGSDPVVQDALPSPVPAPVVEEPVPAAAESDVVESDTIVSAPPESYRAPGIDERAPAPSAWAKFDPVPASEIQHEASAGIEPEPEPSEPPVAAHWMDALAPGQINATGGSWLTSLSSQPASPVAPTAAMERPAPEAAIESLPSHEQVSALAEAEPAAVEPSLPTTEWSESKPVHEVHAALEAPAPEDLFPVSHAVHEDAPIAESVAPVNAEQAESWFAPTPSVFEHVPDPVSEMVPVAHSEPDPGLELEGAASDAPVSLRDPGLMTSQAVHVTPEPLLIDNDEESHGPSGYNSRPAQTSPLHSFFAPASGDPVVADSAAAEPPSPAREEMTVPSFEPPTGEGMNGASNGDESERIPTGPPPNREALASIPFLTPPPDFRVSAPESAASSSAATDEVVRRVLERLEPQLHDLLSQGVLKPLIENLLQNELAKKDK
jgi:CheY-like chemotaxis protein